MFGFQVFRHIATHNPLSQTLGDSRFAGTRLAHKNRVVFRASAKNLQHTSYLVVTAYHRVEFSTAGTLVKVDGIFAQSVVGILRALARSLLALSQFFYRSLKILFGHAVVFQYCRHFGVDLQERYKNSLQCHVFVTEPLCAVDGFQQHIV